MDRHHRANRQRESRLVAIARHHSQPTFAPYSTTVSRRNRSAGFDMSAKFADGSRTRTGPKEGDVSEGEIAISREAARRFFLLYRLGIWQCTAARSSIGMR